jgi:hypothetical protein
MQATAAGGPAPSTGNPGIQATADVLGVAGSALSSASRRDWIGVALQADDALQKATTDRSMEDALRFIRVLLAAYQASTPAEAKAVMQSALEDEGSRERRWSAFTIDAGALVAGRGGVEWIAPTAPNQDNRNAIVGLYAPFGFQIAYKSLGLLLYPIDLGSYLLANANRVQKPAYSAAVRFGGAVYLRPCASVPVDVGVASDFRPDFGDGPQSTRVMGFLALELPLYPLL